MRGPIQLLKDSCTLFIDNIGIFIGIGIIPMAISFAGGFLSGISGSEAEVNFTPTYLIVMFIGSVASILMWIAITKAVSSPTSITVTEAYIFAKNHFFSYLWVNILMSLVIMLGFILLIIPGFIFALWYAFATYTVLFEGKKGIGALKRSKELVKGQFAAIVGRFLFLMLISIVVIVPLVLIMSATVESQSQILSNMAISVLNLAIYPIMTAYMYYIYFDLRKEKETSADGNIPSPVSTPATESVPLQK